MSQLKIDLIIPPRIPPRRQGQEMRDATKNLPSFVSWSVAPRRYFLRHEVVVLCHVGGLMRGVAVLVRYTGIETYMRKRVGEIRKTGKMVLNKGGAGLV